MIEVEVLGDAEQKELGALRELEKVVRADRKGCIYVSDIRNPRSGGFVSRTRSPGLISWGDRRYPSSTPPRPDLRAELGEPRTARAAW